MNDRIPQVNLSPVDWGIMALYMLGLIGMGLWYRRFAGRDLANYFLGGRRLSGWVNGVSNAATCMNADVAPAYCGMTVVTGVYVCWFYFSRFGLALMVAALLFAVFWRRLRIFTSPEFYEVRFSGEPAIAMRTLVSLRSAFVGVVIWIGAGLLGLSKISEALLGWEKWETFAVVIPVILFYVFLSGYMGVVVSDLIQSLIMIVSSVVLMGMVWADFGGPTGLRDALIETFGPGVASWHPPAGDEFLGVVGLVAWTCGTCIGYGGDLSTESQKLLSCRSSREASRMYIWTEIVLFLMLAVLTLPALGAMVRWPGLHDGTINKELSFGLLLGYYLPPGLLGLSLVALFASIMSTVDSHMNYAGQVFINDVYRRMIRKTASTAHYMLVGRLVMCVIMVLAVLVATVFTNVIDISIFMLGLFGAELAANWAQWWWWRFNGKARIAATVGGPLICGFNYSVVFGQWIDAGADTAYLVVLSSIAATCLLWLTVSLVTAPDPTPTLVAFYKRARPIGWWKPIAIQAGMRPVGAGPIGAGVLIALLGMVAVAAGTLALSSVYIARWGTAAACGVVCVGGGWAFKVGYSRVMAGLAIDESDAGASEEAVKQ